MEYGVEYGTCKDGIGINIGPHINEVQMLYGFY